jgi:hypothetical protein
LLWMPSRSLLDITMVPHCLTFCLILIDNTLDALL